MNSMMLMREDGQMGTCRICGKNFGLIGGYMEEFTGERLNVCVDCIKKFRQISEEDSSRVRTIVDDLISSCNNEKTLPILKKYKAKAVADSQMKEQIAIMKKREVEKTPDIIVTTCDLKEDYEVVAPVYFQLSNKGVFSSTYSRLAAEYSSKLQQLKEQGMLANRKADWGLCDSCNTNVYCCCFKRFWARFCIQRIYRNIDTYGCILCHRSNWFM